MDPPRDAAELQPVLTSGTSHKVAPTDGAVGSSLGPRLTTAEYDPSIFTSPTRTDEGISRSLISSGLELSDAVGNAKRTSTDVLAHSRLKKKRTAQVSLSDTRSAALLQSIVPKLGPTLRFRSQDGDQLKKAIEDIQSGNRQSVELGLNFLMGWSLANKGETPPDDVVDVMSTLLDFILDTIAIEPKTASDLFGLPFAMDESHYSEPCDL